MPTIAKKYAVSVFIKNPKNDRQFLAVKRPSTDEIFPNKWCLPTVTLRENELPENAVRRAGLEKINTLLEPLKVTDISDTCHKNCEATIITFETKIVKGKPSISRARTKTTKYTDQKWTERYSLIQETTPWKTAFSKNKTKTGPRESNEKNLQKILSEILVFSHQMYGVKQILRFRGMPGWDDADWER